MRMDMLTEILAKAETQYNQSDYAGAAEHYASMLEILSSQNKTNTHENNLNWLKAQVLANHATCLLRAGSIQEATDNALRCAALQPKWFKAPYLLSQCSTDPQKQARLILEAVVKAQGYLQGSESLGATQYLMGKLLQLAYTHHTFAELRVGMEQCGRQWQDLFVQLVRLEDWGAMDALLRALDTHGLQGAVLCGPSRAPTPRDNMAEIGQRALDAAIVHVMETGRAMRLHTLLRRFQIALDFASQIHDSNGNTLLHQVAAAPTDKLIIDKAYLIQLLLSHGFAARSVNRDGKEAKEFLQEGSLAHRLLAWQSDKDRALLLDLACMQDDEVKRFLHTIICSHGNLSVYDLLPVIPCLSSEEREAVVKVLNNHGNNSAWQQLLRILHSGEEFGLVQLSTAVFKYDINLAKKINRVYHRLSLRGIYSDSPVYKALRRHWSEVVWALSQTFTSTCLDHFTDRAQLHKWFKQVLKAEGCFTAAMIMVQYICRWQGGVAIVELIDRLAEEGYDDLKLRFNESLSEFEENDKHAPELNFKILDQVPWPELEELDADGDSSSSPRSPVPPSKHQKRHRRRKHSARKSSKDAIHPEPLKDFEKEVVGQVSLSNNQLIYMPPVSSHIAVSAGVILQHLRHADNEKNTEWALTEEVLSYSSGIEELDVVGSPEESPLSTPKSILLVVPSKKDVAVVTAVLRTYLPFHKVAEHGIHSSQKMGLLRAVQSNHVVVCSTDSLHHALLSRAFSLQELSLLLVPLPPTDHWASSNYYASLFRQLCKLNSPRSKTSDTASESASEDLNFGPQVVVVITGLHDVEVDSSVVTMDTQVDRVVQSCGVDGLVRVTEHLESLWKEMCPDMTYQTSTGQKAVNGGKGVGSNVFLSSLEKAASDCFGTQGQFHGIVLGNNDLLTINAQEQICDRLKALLTGSLRSKVIKNGDEIDIGNKSTGSTLHFLSAESDDLLVGKIKDKKSFERVNFITWIRGSGEWHIVHGSKNLWSTLYMLVFEAFLQKHVECLS